MAFAAEVFDVLSKRLKASSTFYHLLESGISFENWITAEFYAALLDGGYWVEAMPSYPSLGNGRKWSKGDLKVWPKSDHEPEEETASLLIEIKIAGHGTYGKYYTSIDNDRSKLRGYITQTGKPQAEGMQIILSFAKSASEYEVVMNKLNSLSNANPRNKTLLESTDWLKCNLTRKKKSAYTAELLGWHVWRKP